MTINLTKEEISDLKSHQDRFVQTALAKREAELAHAQAEANLRNYMDKLQFHRGTLANL